MINPGVAKIKLDQITQFYNNNKVTMDKPSREILYWFGVGVAFSMGVIVGYQYYLYQTKHAEKDVASNVIEVVVKYIDGTSIVLTKKENENTDAASEDDMENSNNEAIEEGETEMMESFKGTWKGTSADQYEEFLTALGVNWFLRKAATISTPIMEISEDDGVWTINSSTMLKTIKLEFRIGEEFDDTTPDGREVTATVTLKGNKLITVQKAKKDGEKSTKSIREFIGNKCIMTITIYGIDDLICVLKFKRV